ncbi:putative beta-amylase [Helianthus anomalus]
MEIHREEHDTYEPAKPHTKSTRFSLQNVLPVLIGQPLVRCTVQPKWTTINRRIILPKWVLEEINNDPNLAYNDQWGRMNNEYISLRCGTTLCLKGRTPIHCYSDYMRAFRDKFIFSVTLLWNIKLEWVQPEWFDTHLTLRKTKYGIGAF